jgi:uncharacterized membrane protein YdjX (TVP38/TMEM64 family)
MCILTLEAWFSKLRRTQRLIKSKKLNHLFIYIALLALAAILIHFLFYTKEGLKISHSNIQGLSDYLKSFGSFAIVLGVLAILVQTFIPFCPFMLIAGANVLIFGLFYGFIINYIASCLGAFLAFIFARFFGHNWVERKLMRYPMIVQFNKRMETEGFFYVLLGRLIPIFPSSIVNLGAGISKIRIRHFLFATLLGKFPIVFMESLIAHDLQHLHRYRGRLLLLLTLFILLIIVGNWIRQKSLRRSKNERS